MRHSTHKFASRTIIRLFPIVLVASVAALLTQGEIRRKPLKAPQSLWGLEGSWEDSFTSGVLIHASVLPNGKVLHWTQFSFPPTYSRTWDCVISTNVNPYGQCDPDYNGVHRDETGVLYNGANLFCSGHTHLPDGRLFVAGGSLFEVGHDGTPETTIFKLDPSPPPSPSPSPWIPADEGPPMPHGRWYPTTITLGNGETVIVSGDYCNNHPDPNNSFCTPGNPTYPNNSIPDVLSSDGNSLRQLTGANLVRPLYSWLHLTTDGRVFYAGPNSPGLWLDTAGPGSWSSPPGKPYYYSLNPAPSPEPPDPITSRSNGSSVMYKPDQILIAGGGLPRPTRTAETIDLSNPNNSWEPTGLMTSPRRHHDLTILADGKVLATGGTMGEGFNNVCEENVVYAAELWDPTSGNWSPMASMTRRRQYHSIAVLLRDGRVLVGGSTGEPDTEKCKGFENQYRNEIFTPPYLYNPDGSFAVRPLIHSAPQTINYGQSFYVHTPNSASISKVTMVRLSSVTHSVNMGQRFNELAFQRIGNVLSVTPPSSSNACPPGYYMLFIINNTGVPSIASIVKITQP